MVTAEDIAKKITLMDDPSAVVLVEIEGELYDLGEMWEDDYGDLVIRVDNG